MRYESVRQVVSPCEHAYLLGKGWSLDEYAKDPVSPDDACVVGVNESCLVAPTSWAIMWDQDPFLRTSTAVRRNGLPWRWDLNLVLLDSIQKSRALDWTLRHMLRLDRVAFDPMSRYPKLRSTAALAILLLSEVAGCKSLTMVGFDLYFHPGARRDIGVSPPMAPYAEGVLRSVEAAGIHDRMKRDHDFRVVNESIAEVIASTGMEVTEWTP